MTYLIKVSNQASQGILPCDLTKALICAVPEEELRVIVDTIDIVDALREVVIKNGATDASCVDELILTVTQKRKRDEDLLLCMVQIPELFPGAGPLKCRVCLAKNNAMPLGSVHDFLKWLQVDKDGEQNDWKHWLRSDLEKSMSQVPSDLTDPETTLLVLEYHLFNGVTTPMGRGPTRLTDDNKVPRLRVKTVG